MKSIYLSIPCILTFLILSIQSVQGASNVIFVDTFDNHQNWSTSNSYGISETYPSTKNKIFSGYCDTNQAPCWFSYRTASISNTTQKPLYEIRNDPTFSHSGKSLIYNIENSSYMNGGGVDLYLGGGRYGGHEELFIKTLVKFESGFDFENGGGDFIKVFRLYTGVDPNLDDLAPSSTYATSADQNSNPKIKRSMNAYLDFVADGNSDYRLKLSYFYGQLSGVDYREIIKSFPSSTFNLKDHLGKWLYLQWHVKLNTPNISDGEMRVWLLPATEMNTVNYSNPTAIWTGLKIRSTTDRKLNTIIVADNMSGQWERATPEQTIAIDNLIVSKSFIDPNTNSSAIQSLPQATPEPPSNLSSVTNN